MTDLWTGFSANVERHVQHILQTITDAFDHFLRTIVPDNAIEADAAKTSQPAVRMLADILCHRRDLAIRGTEDAIEDFRCKIFVLETDALAPVRTAFIGRCMEETYQKANLEYGKSTFFHPRSFTFADLGLKDLVAMPVANI